MSQTKSDLILTSTNDVAKQSDQLTLKKKKSKKQNSLSETQTALDNEKTSMSPEKALVLPGLKKPRKQT